MVRLEIPGADLVVRRSDENVDLPGLEPPAPAPAETSFDTEEVEIVHGEVTLAGTITRPRGAKGRLPAVFFVSGSGGQDRNGMSSGMDTGTHEILDRLTAEGFLVLRVDDRGVGSSRGPTEGIGFRDLVADARAAVGFLFEREDVDPERIAIIGHSEGGLTATILAAERPIAALVLMAAAGRSLIDVIVDQNVPALEAGGLKGEALETSLGAIRDHLLRIGGDDDLEAGDLPPEFRSLLANRRWFQDHARERPLERVKALRCPVLILQGDRDIQISPDKDARALERALAESDHADHTLHVIPGLDHLFKNTGGRESEIDQYYEKRPVDEGFLDLLSGWLAQRLLSPGDAGEGGEGGD